MPVDIDWLVGMVLPREIRVLSFGLRLVRVGAIWLYAARSMHAKISRSRGMGLNFYLAKFFWGCCIHNFRLEIMPS